MTNHVAKNCRAPEWKVTKYKESQERDKKQTNSNKSNTDKNKTQGANAVGFIAEVLHTTGNSCDNEWYLDSGCTQYICNLKSGMTNLVDQNVTICVATETSNLKSTISDIELHCKVDNGVCCETGWLL
jgi:hypothetical protein